MSIAQAMLGEFEHELDTTRKFLKRIPENKLTWRPHEKSMTVGQLALHIAEVPMGVLDLAMHDQAAPPDMSEREQPATKLDVLDRLEKTAEHVRETLPTLTDERMRATVAIVQDGEALLALPRAAFLRMIMLNHWYHHRGQLGVYLRLLGESVPAAYGPSGDESPF